MDPLSALAGIDTVYSAFGSIFEIQEMVDPGPDNEAILEKLTQLDAHIEKVESLVNDLQNDLNKLETKINLNQLYEETDNAESTINGWFTHFIQPWIQRQKETQGKSTDDIPADIKAAIQQNCGVYLTKIDGAICGTNNTHTGPWLDLIIAHLMKSLAAGETFPTSVCELAYRQVQYLYTLQTKGLLCLLVAKGSAEYQDTVPKQWFPRQAAVHEKIALEWNKQDAFTWFTSKPTGSFTVFADDERDHDTRLRNICHFPAAITSEEFLTGLVFTRDSGQAAFAVATRKPSTDTGTIADFTIHPPRSGDNTDVLADGSGDSFNNPAVWFDSTRIETKGAYAITNVLFREAYTFRTGDTNEIFHIGPRQRYTYFTPQVYYGAMGPDGKMQWGGQIILTTPTDSGKYMLANSIEYSGAGNLTHEGGKLTLHPGGAPVNGIAFTTNDDRTRSVRIRFELKNSLKLPFFGNGAFLTIGKEYGLYSMHTRSYVICNGEGQSLGLSFVPAPVKPLKAYASLHYDKYREEEYKDDYADGTQLPFKDQIKLKLPGKFNSVKDPLFMAPVNGQKAGTAIGGGFWDYVIYDPSAPDSKADLKVGQPFLLVALAYGDDGKVIGHPVKTADSLDGVVIDASVSIQSDAPGGDLKALLSKPHTKYLWQFRSDALFI